LQGVHASSSFAEVKMAHKVLVVDDEPSVVTIITYALGRKGYHVIQAFDGEQALDAVVAEKPDLVVLDLMMPNVDGWRVYERLKTDPKHKGIKVVVLTGVGEFESQLKSLQFGVDEYLTKPFSATEVAQVVEDVLNEERGERREKERARKEAKLRTIVSIMKRSQEK